MKPVQKSRRSLLSLAAGISLALCFSAHAESTAPSALSMKRLTPDIAVSGQISQESLAQLKARGFATVIDLRPDGEASGQPASSDMASAARANNLQFYYVPVPPSGIPEQAVKQLADALKDAPKPVLMYCRSGSRAARTWSLAEASRPDGMEADAIKAAVREAGQSAEDLNPSIMQRITQRKAASAQKP
ncbi:uncharacterized protein (TIGR01244 family) [Paucimonas lemoignei]|uniref:Uncharacterized protein (TIGR01244 family) n=1 Tax=Paucimonas lemoignei TaxID=29443 RepID=A0A4R3HYV9_PAULE|nr:TIGR01244 family sulfur transferase [Paucimonas lemoignei]TCS37511.1 uncharacterized protein (TIGR01244 family) [Paucimonas lemoignei]